MYKILALCLGVAILLCAPVGAQKQAVADMKATAELPRVSQQMATQLRALPDLKVDSAVVLSAPITYSGMVLVPLEITVTNLGTDTSQDFNVGGWGKSTDGNAYGFNYFVPGEATMPDPRGGALCKGLASGEVKTFTGFLFLGPNPVNVPLQPGTRYEIHAMVDYNLDPDAFGYEWGVSESDENNNELVVNYPPTMPLMMAKKIM